MIRALKLGACGAAAFVAGVQIAAGGGAMFFLVLAVSILTAAFEVRYP